MARRSQCSSAGDNPLDPNYLPPHYREEYRLAIDALVEEDLEGYYKFLQKADVVDFLCTPEIQYIQSSVHVPKQSHYPEQHFLETEGEGSSVTYWPIHSDLDVPDLDLGWPQLHHFIGPTEVTTLVNPPEPDMPSIKEQARRLIKNAQQVIAVVMDMFTDVDMFADILSAAMRNVAVYILLDEQNAHHFVNMVSNCRVNLQSIQFLRVRTVSGVTYNCRSGKSFKGQMMDRFLLTDCRAVLSGNYSFMWSFEKLHRCMAHLFLGQLVSTFDEEFRILFAQSQPLVIENVVAPVEDLSLVAKRQYPTERTSLYREPRKFLSLETGHPEERMRHSYDERMDVDWRMMPTKRQEPLHGPSEMYSRFSSQQPRMDLSFDQGPCRTPMMENPAFKRHSYAEGVHGRLSYPFLQQQGLPEPENQGRQFYRGQQPHPGPGPGPETDYSGYEKFWSQDYHSADQYSDPGLPQEMQPPGSFDPVLNYLSSTRNVDFDQSSEKLLPTADLPFSSSHPRRLSLGQPYACQTSPTPSNPTDQKQFFQEPNTDRKDPTLKQGLRNWRISSYLSAYENPGDEGLSLAPPQAPDPFEEPTNPIQQTAPGIHVTVPKIPNVREFKILAIPRASQMPGYIKNVQEQPKKLPDEPSALAAETKITPTPSDSSSTAEGEKAEEAEQKEPKTTGVRREESFRRKYNAAAPRSSRLRSSLIFSSLDQQHASQDAKSVPGQQDEESDKNEAEQTRLPFVSQVFRQRRSARDPLEWSRYMKSATFDNSATETSTPDDGDSKADDKDPSKVENSKDPSENRGVQESLKQSDKEQSSPSMPRSKPSETEMAKTDQSVKALKPLVSNSLYVDMSDPDTRLMFFKELAAKRKAAKAAETEERRAKKSQEKAMKPSSELKTNTTVKKEEPQSKEPLEKMDNTSASEGLSERTVTADDAGKTLSTEKCESGSLSVQDSDETNKQDSLVKKDPSTSQSCKEEKPRVSIDSEKKELKGTQSVTSLPVSVETESPLSKPHPKMSKPDVKECSHPPTPTYAPADNVLSPTREGTEESESPSHDSTSQESSSLTLSSADIPPSSESTALDSDTQNPESVHLETIITEPVPQFEQQTGSELSSSNPSVQSSFSKHVMPMSGSEISQSLTTSNSAPFSTPAEILCSSLAPEESSSTPSNMLFPNSEKTEGQESVISLPHESSLTTDETCREPTESEPTQVHLDPVSQFPTSSETPSAVDFAHMESEISPDTCTISAEPNISSLQATKKANSEESCAPTPSDKDEPESANNFAPKAIAEEAEDPRSSKETTQTIDVISTESESTQANLGPVFQFMSSQVPSVVDSAHVESDISPDTCAPHVKPDISSLESSTKTNSEESYAATPSKDAPESDNNFVPKAIAEEAEGLRSSKETSQTTDEIATESESTQTNLNPGFQLLPSKTPSVADSAHVGSYISPDTCATNAEPNTSSLESTTKTNSEETCAATPSEKDAPESKDNSVSKAVAEESESLTSLMDVKADSTPLSLSPTKSGLPNISHLESSTSRPDQTETITLQPPREHTLSETRSLVNPGITVSISQSTTNTSSQETQETPPTEPNLTESVTPAPVETVSCTSPQTESIVSLLSSEAEKTETNLSTLSSPSYAPSLLKQTITDTKGTPTLASTETSSPSDPTSKIPTEPEPTPESVTSESLPSEPPVPAENGKIDHQAELSKEPELPDPGKPEDTEAPNKVNKSTAQESARTEKNNDHVKQKNCSELAEITSDEVVPPLAPSKQPKSSQSRYHSSTANVLSSSNLRDDTKLLLEQISANSQSRNETTKESPVTDDEKEDEADKNAKREKERGLRTLSRGQPKTEQEREKVLEKIQTMRKDRKVYSRFQL